MMHPPRTDSPGARAGDRERRWAWPLTWAGLFIALGLLNAVHYYLGGGDHPPPLFLRYQLVTELIAACTSGALLPLAVLLTRRIRRQSHRASRIASHVGLAIAFSLTHTGLIWACRAVAFPLSGLGPSSYAFTPYRATMEFSNDVILYSVVVCLTWLVDHYRQARARELRTVQLESALTAARLEALRLQLNPHFLFNALNAVADAMYDDPAVADEMLARIADLLRATLAGDTQEHTLADELRLLQLYVDIQHARFDERLQVRWTIADGLEHTNVPFLVLQPLLENAIEHGGRNGTVEVEVGAVTTNRGTEFSVRDHGDGRRTGQHHGHGIGLANLEARLRHLYGESAGLSVEPAPGGGTEVRFWLPDDRGTVA